MVATDRWALAVRGLLLLCVVLAAAAVLEGFAVRRARAELQTLRDEREKAQAGQASVWARQSREEFGRVLKGLHEFYADPIEGFGRSGGLCPSGNLDTDPIVTFALGTFLDARGAGQSTEAALDTLNTAIRKSDAYRAIHPEAIPAK